MVRPRATQRGVSYLALLLAVAITSGALAAGATVWSQVQRRQREAQLLWAGDQIRRALLAYSAFGAGGAEGGDSFPRTLEDLLLDPRSPAKRRFLRKVYDDPITHSTDWGLVRNAQGRIIGVYSRSTAAPLKSGRFPRDYAAFARARSYADWRFSALEELQPAGTPAAPGASAPTASAPAASAPAASAPAAASAVGATAASSAAAASAAAPGTAPIEAPAPDMPAPTDE
uniref:type II secretion system protein n=1 Tax=Ideonella sp. A 288 TaxID=1962181 RepID=UPI0018FEC581